MEVNVNWLAIVLAGLSTMVVGAIFYNPKVFGTRWAKLAKVNMDAKVSSGKMAWKYGSVLVASLVTAFVLAHVTFLANHYFGGSFLMSALSTAFWLWLGFTILRIYTHDTFEDRPVQLTALAAMYEFIAIVVMALIIGAFGLPA